ncbi:hypothetical protein BDV96DRAFT_643356 [Lophiotrema nucula]|uniref:Uncharacterized protein n=1 Tax=Lophiotrema nucula TaxID=690887 RepID=A0A6A5ZI62_9PLEO|nr:hypothetical protein BDV96DRAFT_643356 [Lophiotrema nucula]
MKLFFLLSFLAYATLIATAIAFPPPPPNTTQPDPSVTSPISLGPNGNFPMSGHTGAANYAHGTCHLHMVIDSKCCQQWSVGEKPKHHTYAWFSYIRDANENSISEVDQYIGKWYMQTARCGGLEDGDLWYMEDFPLSYKWYEWQDKSDGSYHMKMTFSFNGVEWDEDTPKNGAHCNRGDWTAGNVCGRKHPWDRYHDMDCWFPC